MYISDLQLLTEELKGQYLANLVNIIYELVKQNPGRRIKSEEYYY